MKKRHLHLGIALLIIPLLACQIVTVGSNITAPQSAKELPTLADALPTLANAANACLLVHALPGGEGSLNLRSGAGTSYPVLAVLHDGQTLVMDGQNGDWYAVTVVMDDGALSGFVHADYVEVCE